MSETPNYSELGRLLDAALGGYANASKYVDDLEAPDAHGAAVALTKVKVDLQSAHPGSLHLEEAIADYLRENAEEIVELALDRMSRKGDELRAAMSSALEPRRAAEVVAAAATGAQGPGAAAPKAARKVRGKA